MRGKDIKWKEHERKGNDFGLVWPCGGFWSCCGIVEDFGPVVALRRILGLVWPYGGFSPLFGLVEDFGLVLALRRILVLFGIVEDSWSCFGIEKKFLVLFGVGEC